MIDGDVLEGARRHTRTYRLARILDDPQRPVQIVIAGKAHPEDPGGQALIEEWMAFTQRTDVRGRAPPCGHYVPEEAPEETLQELRTFFRS